MGGGRRGGRVGFGRGGAGAVFRRNHLPDFGVSYDPSLNHLIRRHQHRLRSSGRGPSRCKAVHISNDRSVMLPSSFGITRWCPRAIHLSFGDLTLLAAIRPDHSAVVSWLVGSFLQSILAGLLTAFLLRHWVAKLCGSSRRALTLARPATALACCLCEGSLRTTHTKLHQILPNLPRRVKGSV